MRYIGVSWQSEPLPLSFAPIPPGDLVWSRWGSQQPGNAVHGFVDDWRFQSLYRSGRVPFDLFDKIWATEPDCSIYWGMPQPVVQYQVYRARLGGHKLRCCGMLTIPVVRWADHPEWSVFGIKHGSSIAIRAPSKDNRVINSFLNGIDYAIDVIQPSFILVFGVGSRIQGALDSSGVPWRQVALYPRRQSSVLIV